MLRRLGRFLTTYVSTVAYAVLIIAVNVLGFMRWQVKRSPQYAIEEAAQCIRARDGGRFETFVDVRRVAESYYDQHLYPVHVRENRATPERRTHESGAILRRLRRWVETGRIDESEFPRLTLLGDALTGALGPGGRTQLARIATTGTLAIGLVQMQDHRGRRFDLEVKMVPHRGSWKITEITNVEELVKRLRSAEMRRIRIRNAPIERVLRAGTPVSKGATEVNKIWRETFDVPIENHGAIAAHWIARCQSEHLTGPPVARRLLLRNQPNASIEITCFCQTRCSRPDIVISSVRTATAVLRREEPLPLD